MAVIPANAIELAELWQQQGVRQVRAGLFDIDAVFREKWLPIDRFAEYCAQGWSFIDALPYWGANDSMYGDRAWNSATCEFDINSTRRFPFAAHARTCVADYSDGNAALSPRAVLKRQVEKASAMGFGVRASSEFELILLDESSATLESKAYTGLDTFAPHNRCWSGYFPASDADLLEDYQQMLASADIEVDHICAELGPGCLEVSLPLKDIVRAADDAAFFKLYSKAFFQQRDLTCSFMAQLSNSHPGLGGHPIISLWQGEHAVFYDASKPDGVSDTMRCFIGGVLALLPELTAMFASTVNAYRRYVPGNWAPRTATWGVGNYTCGLRAVCDNPARSRLEFRLPGADINPFLAFAMVLGAGLYGIEHRLRAPQPRDDIGREFIDETIGPLPRNLLEAGERLAASSIAKALFGEQFIEHYARTRILEDEALRRHVSDFERRRYLHHV